MRHTVTRQVHAKKMSLSLLFNFITGGLRDSQFLCGTMACLSSSLVFFGLAMVVKLLGYSSAAGKRLMWVDQLALQSSH